MRERGHNFIRALAGIAAAVCLLPALLLVCGFALPPQYEDTFLGEMKYKLERLRAAGGPRLIVVGGSSVPFGLKCALAEQYLPGYQVIDFGMYADMGAVVMLDWAAAEAREGNVFVIVPEQSAQALSCRVDGEDVWQCADGAWELLGALDAGRYERLAAAFPAFAGKKLRYALTGAPSPEGAYSRAAFDGYGDIAWPGRAANILPGGYDPNMPISFDPGVLDPAFTEELNDFARTVTAKGAKVLYHFPPMNSAAVANGTTAADIDRYYDYLRGELLFPVLGDPHRCVMDSGWFYDTNFHLNSSGAVVFTKTLIEDVKLWLRDTSPTDIPLPAMPAPAAASYEGDSSDAGCFTARREGDGWVLDGLTGQGKAAERLTVPTEFEGGPVVGLDPALFIGDAALRELTVQPNIRALHDGMFRGCTALERLVLTGSDPAACAVGDALMDGAEFFIAVPEGAVDSYRRSYSWQRYEPWLTASE